MRVLVLGAALLDIIAQPVSKTDRWEQKQLIDAVEFYAGGDAANQCIRLADIGIEAGVISAVGNDRTGMTVKAELEQRNVDTGYLLEKSAYQTGTSLVLLDSRGERTIFTVRDGAYASLDSSDIKRVSLSGVDALSVASFLMENTLEDDGGMEGLLSEARRQGILTFADLSHDKRNLGLDGIRRFLPYLDYFLPSLYDARKMNGLRTAEENAGAYKELGCKNVIIKCGADGCYVLADEYAGFIKARSVQTVDTTGAGDCMVALFISGILRGLGTEEAARFACGGATLSTLYKGASAHKITAEDIAAFEAEKQPPG